MFCGVAKYTSAVHVLPGTVEARLFLLSELLASQLNSSLFSQLQKPKFLDKAMKESGTRT